MRSGSAKRRLLLTILIPLLAFTSLAAWAFSSPVGSSPDDDFHLAAIWCGLGERAGLCENPGDGTTHRLVPSSLPTAPCYAFNPEQSGDCWVADTAGLTMVVRANADGLYPPVFYATMSLFAGSDPQASVIVMRLFNALFAVVLLTVTFFALPRWMRPALVISVLATSVPLGVFVYASTNPSAWAMLSAAVVWISLYGATQTSGRQRWTLASLAVFGGFIGAGARADAAVYACFAVVLALILGLRRTRSGLLAPVAASALILVIGVAFYLTAGQGGAVVSGMTEGNPPLTAGQLLSNFLEIPSLWSGAVGGWNLGWLDTRLPAAVSVLVMMVVAGVLFVGVRRVDRRRTIALALALAALWVVPFVLLYQSRIVVGTIVQPRYLLPLMVIALGIASLRRDAEQAWSGARIVLAGAALTFAFAVSLQFNIQRYTTGVDRSSIDPGAGAEWWWTGAPAPLAVWIMGSLAFAAVITLLATTLPGPEREPSTASREDGSDRVVPNAVTQPAEGGEHLPSTVSLT
ncbi:DUF2142 domain-containing protein [Microbacterium hominis]|uniref:DUF2142 domain-containing protein n=1 Tax=Microbacterium hominis TaxID=162426 RepID=UPI001962EFB4|nr:DUF2142 domain-containing protein [Microbacterium hominis]QRY41701.1 DUF2142 domain-containing protein [Microbacterium hominis]